MNDLYSLKESIRNLIIEERLCKNHPVTEVNNDSRNVSGSSIFVAICGAKSNAHNYIDNALEAGATAVVHSEKFDRYVDGVTFIRVKDTYFAYALLVEQFYSKPADKIDLFGITGTNGKTTTSFILQKLLSAQSGNCGLISTVKYFDGKATSAALRTTPDAKDIQKLFSKMVSNNCSSAVMEVSSHGLQQHRTGSAKFKCTIFTNMTGDHLDYHGNMENYFEAKKILFDEHIAEDGFAVINIDDTYGKKLASELTHRKVLTFGKSSSADYLIKNIRLSSEKSSFTIEHDGYSTFFETNLTGEFNIYNITAAIVAGNLNGLTMEQAAKIVREPLRIPGRLEKLISQNGAVFFVDYAHTDDALGNVLLTLSTFTNKRLITLFGCGGDRDKTKRARMGQVAAQYSDIVLITSDNPRSEAPEAIISDIIAGIPDNTQYFAIPDRRDAIAESVRLAEPGDTVLIAGKGDEAFQEIDGRFEKFNDINILSSLLDTNR